MNATTQTPPGRRGWLLVLSGPSGVGKTTLARRLCGGDRDAAMVRSVSVTTRPARPGERDGIDYTFVDGAAFAALLAGGALLEHTTVFGHRYGTLHAPVAAALAAGRDVVLVLDEQGRRQVAARYPNDTLSVFLLPPSARERERRLRGRGDTDAATLAERLADAHAASEPAQDYDSVLVLRDPDHALAELDAFRRAAGQPRARLPALTVLGNATGSAA